MIQQCELSTLEEDAPIHLADPFRSKLVLPDNPPVQLVSGLSREIVVSNKPAPKLQFCCQDPHYSPFAVWLVQP